MFVQVEAAVVPEVILNHLLQHSLAVIVVDAKYLQGQRSMYYGGLLKQVVLAGSALTRWWGEKEHAVNQSKSAICNMLSQSLEYVALAPSARRLRR